MTKTNWKNKLKKVLGKDEFSEVSTNSQLTKADKTQIKLVSSVNVSDDLVDTFQKSTNSPEYNEESKLVSSAFVSGQLVDSSRNNNELADFKTDYFHNVFNRFIEAGIVFEISIDDFHFIDEAQKMKLSDLEFLKLNNAAVLCHLQQSLLMKHLFNHSPKHFEDFAFEVMEREAIFLENCLNSPLTITAKTPFEIYVETVKEVTKKWFTYLLEEMPGAVTNYKLMNTKTFNQNYELDPKTRSIMSSGMKSPTGLLATPKT